MEAHHQGQLQPPAGTPPFAPLTLGAGCKHDVHHHLTATTAATAMAVPGSNAAAAADMAAYLQQLQDAAAAAEASKQQQQSGGGGGAARGEQCPRCASHDTKFCYYNNYNTSQPRHFCRACRRYWTRGGALRNVPVGGGYRRHAKRAKPKQAAAAGTTSSATATAALAPAGSATSSAACTTTTNVPALPGGPAMLGGNHLSMLPPLLRLADFDAMSLGSSFSGMGKPPSLDAA